MFRIFSYINLPFFLFLLFFSLLLPPFPARIIPADTATELTVSDDSNKNNASPNATWHNFARFLDMGRGSSVAGISELKSYFQRFGYLPSPAPGTIVNFTDAFDETLESALTAYQKKLGLPVTGKLDSGTVSQIMSPRCGISDDASPHSLHATKHYAYFYGQPRWDDNEKSSHMILTYGFSPKNMISYINTSDVKAAFRRAFSRWSAVIPVNFTEVVDYTKAEIKIGFYRGDHGDGEPFDGVLGVLAHAFSPENGRFHLDAAETWAVDFKEVKSKVAVDLESVATHEIGHVLGLAHSSVKEAVMYPSLSPRTKKVDLKLDDVDGIQALYGSNPNYKYSSLLESVTSSGRAIGRPVKWVISLVMVVVLRLSLFS